MSGYRHVQTESQDEPDAHPCCEGYVERIRVLSIEVSLFFGSRSLKGWFCKKSRCIQLTTLSQDHVRDNSACARNSAKRIHLLFYNECSVVLRDRDRSADARLSTHQPGRFGNSPNFISIRIHQSLLLLGQVFQLRKFKEGCTL